MNNTKQFKFSICVPSYNRGNKALTMALQILPEMDDDWELLILDNASELENEAYQKIQELSESDSRLRYIRHDVNRMMHGNFLASFNLALSPFIMLVSDEDFANTDMIRNILPLLTQFPSVGVMRGGISPVEGVKPQNSHNRLDASYIRGQEALMGFAYANNYFSGTIYNRQLFFDLGLIEKLTNGINQNAIYPHLYLELLAAAVSDVVTTSQISCFEGSSQLLDCNRPNSYSGPYSFGSRVDQFVILRDATWEAVGLVKQPFDIQLFATMYLKLCEKYMFLITRVNSNMYLQHRVHTGLLHEAMLYICGAAISLYPEVAPFETYLFSEIKKIHDKYRPYV